MHAPKAILFDADGVIQRPAVDYRTAFAALAALETEEANRFMGEIFAAEKPALSGQGDFLKDLESVLARWSLSDRLADALEIWTAIETDSAMLTAVAALRSFGIQCCLATNQQAYRGNHMSETLRYRELFDVQFYSYRLGFTKPASEYFRMIVKELNLEPSDLLFIDDHEPNVTAAREVGLRGALFNCGPDSAETLRVILLEHGISLR